MTETRTGFDAPEFRRLRYFHGQLLGARDLQREQEYFREKLKLRMRCLLGYGVVCGLRVESVVSHTEADADVENQTTGVENQTTDVETQTNKAKVRLTSGLGVDACGNEVVVRHDCTVDLHEALPAQERTTTETHTRTLWIGVEYAEQAVEPTRTVFTSGCSDTSDCEFGWTLEGYRIRVTATRPERDERCDTCCDDGCGGDCGECEHRTLWLARIEGVDFNQPVKPDQINLGIRRPFGRHVPTVITGISWIHGHAYTVKQAQELLGTTDEKGGLRVHFSDKVRKDSLQPGVLDVQVIEGGAGRNAESWFMGGVFAGLPNTEFVDEFRYRQNTREVLQDGDRVLITLRTAFLLDRCCRPVAGTHVGGRVPLIGGSRAGEERTTGCQVPPSGIGPWTSGNGVGGDVFESWFFVREG